MRKQYKNKRDFYKAQMEEAQRQRQWEKERADNLAKKLEEKKELEKKRYSATVYCTNCMVVSNVSIPPGVTIKEGDCVHCRVRNCQLPVVDYPGKL